MHICGRLYQASGLQDGTASATMDRPFGANFVWHVCMGSIACPWHGLDGGPLLVERFRFLAADDFCRMVLEVGGEEVWPMSRTQKISDW